MRGTLLLLAAALLLGGAGTSTAQPAPAATEDRSESPSALPPKASSDPVSALREGNQLFRGGRLEEAEDAYRDGWDPARPHPLLAYNLATTLHHLGELPEAILWYRRAEAADDPWRDENLDLARRTLGAPRTPAPTWTSRLADGLALWVVGALVAAWLVPLALLVPGRRGAFLAAGFSVLALGAGGVWGWLAARAPVEVVLLEECRGDVADLPAGTETRAERLADGWRISGLGLECEDSVVAAVQTD